MHNMVGGSALETMTELLSPSFISGNQLLGLDLLGNPRMFHLRRKAVMLRSKEKT